MTLGTNGAAQVHADNLVKFCVFSHWGVDGTKPYMRYSLAGGFQCNQENVYGLGLCVPELTNVTDMVGNVAVNIHKAMSGWMLSEGHRENILDQWHEKVNIGIAWDAYSLAIVQHFEDFHVAMGEPPSIVGGFLSLSGQVRSADILEGLNPIIVIYYDPPPSVLTIPQILEGGLYFYGRPIVALTSTDTDATIPYNHQACGNPYDADIDLALPETFVERNSVIDETKQVTSNCEGELVQIPTSHVAQRSGTKWSVNTRGVFDITGRVGSFLTEYGSGVYTVEMRSSGEKSIPLLQYSIFHRTAKPAGYGP